jgi:hypothetical protein
MIRDEKSTRPDEELARLAANGDAAAFDEIYSRHRRLFIARAGPTICSAADSQKIPAAY